MWFISLLQTIAHSNSTRLQEVSGYIDQGVSKQGSVGRRQRRRAHATASGRDGWERGRHQDAGARGAVARRARPDRRDAPAQSYSKRTYRVLTSAARACTRKST